jgi:hypothetical protein
MLKTIPKSSVSVRDFKVHKNWTIDNTEIEVISASLESGVFDANTSNKQGNVYTSPLYQSIKAKYYNHEGNIILTFGDYSNIANLETERALPSTAYIIDIPQTKYGEAIKKGSVNLYDVTNDVTYADNANGQITSQVPLYNFTFLDFETEEITIVDNDNESFNGTISSFDAETGFAILTFGTDTDIVTVTQINTEGSTIQFAQPLDFDGIDIDEQTYGNIFYSDGLLVLRPQITAYTLRYKSTQTIYETEVLITAKAGEFNYSQNPSAVDVTLGGSYDFTETAINNVRRKRTTKIKSISDIKRKESFGGSYGSTTGSWNDYFDNQLSDPTGSYLTTYITTIGLYDTDGDMVAIAKLPKPIKNLPDYDMNFIIRFDT